MASFRLFVILIISCCAGFAAAQENRYMVFFKDKENVPYDVSKPIEFLSERAISRRLKSGVDVTVRDLPVQQSYVSALRDQGAKTFFTTRWMNAVLVQCEPSLLASIESLSFVEKVELVAPQGITDTGGRRSVQQRKRNNTIGFETENQLRMLGIDQMHQAGYQGEGVVIAVLDSGFPGVNSGAAFQHVFSEDRFYSEVSYDFVHNKQDVFAYDDHGTEVLSVIAAVVPDAYTGGAYEASFQLFITEDVPTEYRIEEYNWLFAAERADSAGADVIHSSLGYYDFDDESMNYALADMDGKTTVVSKAAQWAADRGILIVTSAGNEGAIPNWRIVTAPADAEGVLAIGGVTNTLQKTSSSSIGPTADGRIKPDFVALGASVKVVKANGQVSTASGTSLAAPLVTSLVTGLIQLYPELTAKEIITLMRATSSNAANPDNLIGFGIPNFQAIVNYHENKTQESPFAAYPNPTKDTLHIRPSDPNEIPRCDIEIFTSYGQRVINVSAQFDWLKRTYSANVAPLTAGIYYVRVSQGEKRYTFKILKL